MNTLEIGRKLVEYCNQDDAERALNELYGNNIVSIEPIAMEDGTFMMEGLDAIRGKHAWWDANHEIHESSAEGPYVGRRDHEFVVKFVTELTPNGGERLHLEELGVYTVADGKIVREEFLHIPDAS